VKHRFNWPSPAHDNLSRCLRPMGLNGGRQADSCVLVETAWLSSRMVATGLFCR
jgi:hypothetical protein